MRFWGCFRDFMGGSEDESRAIIVPIKDEILASGRTPGYKGG